VLCTIGEICVKDTNNQFSYVTFFFVAIEGFSSCVGTFFSTSDLRQGYFQLPMDTTHGDKTLRDLYFIKGNQMKENLMPNDD
jgi:hypothetical protein